MSRSSTIVKRKAKAFKTSNFNTSLYVRSVTYSDDSEYNDGEEYDNEFSNEEEYNKPKPLKGKGS